MAHDDCCWLFLVFVTLIRFHKIHYNYRKLLERRLKRRVTQLHFGTPEGKIDIWINIYCFLACIRLSFGSFKSLRATESIAPHAAILLLIFLPTGKPTLDFGHPL